MHHPTDRIIHTTAFVTLVVYDDDDDNNNRFLEIIK